MHPLGLLLSIIFCTVQTTHMLTETFRTLKTDDRCCWMRDDRTSRIQQHLMGWGVTIRAGGAQAGRTIPSSSRKH